MYIEGFTAVLVVKKQELEALYERKIIIDSQEFVKKCAERILDDVTTSSGGPQPW